MVTHFLRYVIFICMNGKKMTLKRNQEKNISFFHWMFIIVIRNNNYIRNLWKILLRNYDSWRISISTYSEMSNSFICINNFTWVYSMYWEKFTLKGPLIYELYVKQFHFWKDFHAIGNFLQKQNWFSHQKLMMRSTNFHCSKFWGKGDILEKINRVFNVVQS